MAEQEKVEKTGQGLGLVKKRLGPRWDPIFIGRAAQLERRAGLRIPFFG